MKQKGYTLVEMVIVVGLTALLGVAIVAMFLSTARGGGKAGALARVKEEGEYTISTMERQVRFASSIVSPLCTPAGDPKVYDDEFRINLVDGSWYRYYTNGGTQILREYLDASSGNSGSNEPVTSNEVLVSNYQFNCVESGGTINATISFNMGISRENISETFTSNVVLRNTN